MYGAISKDFDAFNQAWNVIKQYMIPELQYNINSFKSTEPVYNLDFSVGVDPIAEELKSAYSDDKLFLMHWLLDVDDNFGFGNVQVGIFKLFLN